jgi:hypothetical protein
MKYSVQIDLTIRSFDGEPDAISILLGVTPETALRKGARNPTLGLPVTSLWSKRSQTELRDAGLEAHWQALARDFAGKEALVRQATRGGSARFTILVDGTGRVPSIIIPREFIAFAAAVNADVDVDVSQ